MGNVMNQVNALASSHSLILLSRDGGSVPLNIFIFIQQRFSGDPAVVK